jgi:alpha-tubulin suppressor-like RCC1 family protein
VAVGQTNAIGVSDWKDIVAIAAGYSHTVGLKADGTVVVAGNFGNDPGVAGWKDIVAVGAGMGWTVGVKKDGTCVAAGSNGSGGCDVSDWRDIVSVVCTYGTTTGLKSDGTVVMTTFKPTTPANKENNEKHPLDTSKWRRIIDIRCSNWQVIGLRDDGRVEFCGKRPDACNPCREWQDIQAVGATEESVMGVKSDGSVVALGTEFDKRPLKAVNGWNLGPVDPKFPRVPHGRDRRLPWPEE